LTLPDDLVITYRVDQPNVVTLVLSPSDSRRVLAHLQANLGAEHAVITGSSGDSLTFDLQGWQGAFTSNDQQAALTLRRR
jgi:hypothetical protein